MRRGYEEEKEDEEKEMIINERDVFLRYLCSLYQYYGSNNLTYFQAITILDGKKQEKGKYNDMMIRLYFVATGCLSKYQQGFEKRAKQFATFGHKESLLSGDGAVEGKE